MQRVFLGLLTALAVVVLPQYLTAEDGKRPERPRPEVRPEQPNPEVMFQRLDVNHKGVIRLDKLPAGMPERMKQMLIRADANKDGKLTLEELKKAMKGHRPGSRPEAGPQPSMPNARAIFERLDTNKDGKLSFDEFCVGLRHLRQALAVRAQDWKPLSGGVLRQARERMPAFGQEFGKKFFAKAPQFPHQPGRGLAMKGGFYGHKHPQGMKSFKGHECQICGCTCPFCMRGFPGRQAPYGMARQFQGHQRPYGMTCQLQGFYHSHWQWMGGFQGRELSRRMEGFEGRDGRERPNRMEGFQGHKKPDMKKKPSPKAPPKKFEKKAEAGNRSIEVRLTALENQQAAILVALQEQQAAVMAALQQTNDLVNARLAAFERPQGGFEPMARQSRPERGPRELSSRVGRNPWHSEDNPQDDDRD